MRLGNQHHRRTVQRTHSIREKCFRLFVKGPGYEDWSEVDQINHEQTFTNDNPLQPNKDAGGSWQIVLTNQTQPNFGSGSSELGSVSVVLDLGILPSGIPAGKLLFQTENIGPTTYTPAALQQVTLSANVEVLRSGTDIRRIHT